MSKKSRTITDASVVLLASLASLYLCGMLTRWVENMPFLGMLGVSLIISVICTVAQTMRNAPSKQATAGKS